MLPSLNLRLSLLAKREAWRKGFFLGSPTVRQGFPFLVLFERDQKIAARKWFTTLM